MSFIAGRYTATLGGLALGQTAEGFRLAWKFAKRAIMGDAGAETKQDSVYRGVSEFTVEGRLIEYNAAGIKTAIWPYATTIFDPGIVGVLDVGSNKAKPLILTAVAGTTAVPASITIPLACLAEGFPIELLLGPDLREVPFKFDCYPGEVISSGAGLGPYATQV